MEAELLALMCQCSPSVLWDTLMLWSDGEVSAIPANIVALVREVRELTDDPEKQRELIIERIEKLKGSGSESAAHT